MSLVLNVFTVLILIVFSVKTFALESSDIVDTQILKIYNKNVLVLNRGLEDAILKKDHIKITSDDGFIARGICIKTSMLTSHWKIYRVVRPELVSKDTLYKMRSINQSEIPKSLGKFSKVDFSKYFSDFGDKDVNKQLKLQQERIAKYDLPESTKSTDVFKESQVSKFDKFVETNFNDETLKNDLSSFYLDLFASPISWQTRYNQKENHFGAKLYNKGEKYQFEINLVEAQRKILDPVTKEGFNSKSTHQDIHFQFNRLSENFSVISFVSYDKEKIGNNYYPYDYYQVGVLGFKYHIWEDDPKSNFFEISYTPAFDTIKLTDPTSANFDLIEREGIRHIIRARYYSDFSKTLHNKTEIVYAPFVQLSSQNFDYQDTRTTFETTFSYDLGKSFFWDYKLGYERDDLRAEVYNIGADNTTQTFRFRYEFDI